MALLENMAGLKSNIWIVGLSVDLPFQFDQIWSLSINNDPVLFWLADEVFVPAAKFQEQKKLFLASLSVSATIYVNVNSPNLS